MNVGEIKASEIPHIAAELDARRNNVGEVVQIGRKGESNGAREALQKQLFAKSWNEQQVDFLLMELWADGFKVVPLGPDDDK